MDEIQANEISIKEIFAHLRGWIYYLKTKWVYIFICALIGGASGYFFARKTKPKYSASILFVLSTEKGGGALTGLASQFGLDMGGGSNNDVFAGDNIIGLMKSKNMIIKTLLKKLPDNKGNLANLISKAFSLDEGWLLNERTKSAYPFPDNGNENLNPIQDSLLRGLYSIVAGEMVQVTKPDKKQSFFQVTTMSGNENISFYLTNYLVEATSAFYIDTKTSIARQNLNMLQHEADSLRLLLGGSISSIANTMDMTFNMNPAYLSKRATAQETQVMATALGTAYTEVLKNLELAKINVRKETPLYQIIDRPTLPLEVINMNRRMAASVGLLLSQFLILSFFLITYVMKKRAKN
ncbi:MAG: lipopolysaccharide biosynthesis protein [Bacteroidota bacterium]